ncbi:MAG TPA: 3-phosphoshikimate 1-carboxyvinyltransferase, partial [Acidimicrobiales bacterium]|nr:3-phosphoshikimate 1-carboxyvinyltransferase [Acidimicrobiales bacterium]
AGGAHGPRLPPVGPAAVSGPGRGSPAASASGTLVVAGPTPLTGRLRVPGDKSISHRALILGALAEGTSTVRGLSSGDDVARTSAAVQAMGAVIDGDRITGGRGRLHEPADVIDVGNSGTGIRLLAGLCAGRSWLTVLTGDESVRSRPMDRVVAPLRQMGADVDGRQGAKLPPLTVRGGSLRGLDYAPPVASAQVKSAVLLAGLAAEGETVVRERLATRSHTEEMLKEAGADITVHRIGGGLVARLRPSPLTPFELDVPGDPSQAAFWVVAACIVPGSEVTVEDVYIGPGRAGFVDVLERMGADVELVDRRGNVASIRARHAPLRGATVSAEEIPSLIDEIPVLAVAAAVADGTTTFRGAEELRVKETDRVATVGSELGALGARIEGAADGLTVHGGGPLSGARVRSHGDHRVAMAMAVAGLAAKGATTVDGWEAVATSYPGFESDLESLGGR